MNTAVNLWLRPVVAALLIAGVGSARAAVVVTDPDGFIPVFGEFPPVAVDFDHNGIDDISVWISGFRSWADGENLNRVVGLRELGADFAVAYPNGEFIGSTPRDGSEWRTEELIMSSCPSGGGMVRCFGQFDGGRSYLGVEFDSSGQVHYGWIEIESDSEFTRVSIHRWAYETEPGVGIVAGIPEPSTGVLLVAAAAAGVLRRRR